MVLRVTCPECGERDAPGARFCRTCGTALEPPVDAALRRFVAVVRSDVQGSTGLGERHDPELLRQVLTRYYDAARSACTYHGGTIEQIQGDAVVAIFDGHEDDALRAVRAAIELRDRMTRLNEELEHDAAIRLPIRMAVECGEVVAGADGPGQLTGEVMNVVAHLEKAAGPGEILLGETAHRLVREAADVEELGPLVLKGKQRPVHAYRLQVLRPGVAGRVHLAVPMVGRQLEVKGFLGPVDERIPDRAAKVEDALRLFDRLSDDRGLARAWRAKAYAHWTVGRLTDAELACRKAIGFAQRAGDEQMEAAAVSSRCFIMFWGPKPLDEVRREVEDALGWARSRGIRRLEMDALHILARISGMRERFAEARALLRQADAGKKAEPRDLLVRVGMYLSTALVELMAGEPAAAERVLRRSQREFTELKWTGQLPPVAILLARALIMQGRDEEAMQLINDYEQLALTSRDAQIKWNALRALLLARRGEAEAAVRLAAEAVALAGDWEQDDSTAEVQIDYAYVLRLAGKDREARQTAQQALDRYRRKGNLVGIRRARPFLVGHPVTSAGRDPSTR